MHESGHALVAALSPNADPVAKVTILPAGQALGVTEQLPTDERHLYSESYLKDSLAVRLQVALFLHAGTTGVHDARANPAERETFTATARWSGARPDAIADRALLPSISAVT